MSWSLEEAKQRDAKWTELVPGHAEHDRRELLALVERLADRLREWSEDKDEVSLHTRREMDALLRELEERDAR